MKNYFDLTEEETTEIKEKVNQRVGQYNQNPFTYYINNVVSAFGNPYRLGSAISDIVYWHEDKSRGKLKMDLDIVGYILNETCYNEKYDFGGKTNKSIVDDIIENICHPGMKEQSRKRIYGRYIDIK